MRIALPIWKDKLSPVLDTASRLLIVDGETSKDQGRSEVHLVDLDVRHRAKQVARIRVEVLICGAVSRPFKDMLFAKGIRVISGISGRIDDIVQAFFDDDLDQIEFLMPGYDHPNRTRTLLEKKSPPPKRGQKGGEPKVNHNR